jgi:ribosomal protein L11 methyltransferase
MPWLELQLQVSEHIAESIGELLSELGALSVSFHDAGDQPLYEPAPDTQPLWQQTKVHGLFTMETNLDEIVKQLQTHLGSTNNLPYQIIHIEDKDWQKEYQNNTKAICITNRLWICPSWDTVTIPEDNPAIVHLDPGLAFGTGSHATTRLCLEWLAKHLTRSSLVIDYGCGSGILAIAALKLGAQKVYAIDIDAQALQATHNNALRNDLSDNLLITALPENLPEMQADLLIANILALPLIELAAKFAKLLKPGGEIVLSGILSEQHEMILSAYEDNFDLREYVELDGWLCLSGKKI